MSNEKTWEDEFLKNNKLMDVSSYQDDRIRDWIKLARYSGYMEACKKRNEENEQLKQQLEEMTNKCAEVNFDKNCLVSDLNERGKDLFHLRDHNKKLADQNRELKQQLEEAVDVINWYAECQDVGVRARQFLAKYRGGK